MYAIQRLRVTVPLFGCVNKNLILAQQYSKGPSKKQVAIFQKAWCDIEKQKGKIGVAFFAALFKKHPEYAKFFSKWGKCPEDLLKNKKFVKDHVERNVMGALGKIVHKLGNKKAAKKAAKQLGKKHKKYCLKKSHFKNAKKVMTKTVKKQLGNKLSCDGKSAVKKVFKLIFKGLKKGLK